MPLQGYRLILPQGAELKMTLDNADFAHRDVLAHFSHGQAYEHETSWIFVKALRPGDAVLDVGANAGYFSILSAVLVGSGGYVVSFEANPASARLIHHNAVLNEARHVRVEEIAVSDRAGSLVFSNGGANDSNGGVVVGKRPQETLIIDEKNAEFIAAADTLDTVVRRHGPARYRLLKIDTEGYELTVLRGAAGLLAERRIDYIVCELNLSGLERNGTDQHALRRFVLDYGYHTFLPDPDGGLPTLVPPGSTIVQEFTCNVLFAAIETLAETWPTVRNQPAASRLLR